MLLLSACIVAQAWGARALPGPPTLRRCCFKYCTGAAGGLAYLCWAGCVTAVSTHLLIVAASQAAPLRVGRDHRRDRDGRRGHGHGHGGHRRQCRRQVANDGREWHSVPHASSRSELRAQGRHGQRGRVARAGATGSDLKDHRTATVQSPSAASAADGEAAAATRHPASPPTPGTSQPPSLAWRWAGHDVGGRCRLERGGATRHAPRR